MGFESVRKKEEIARMHAKVTGIPDLAVQAINDGLTVLGLLLAGTEKEKDVQ